VRNVYPRVLVEYLKKNMNTLMRTHGFKLCNLTMKRSADDANAISRTERSSESDVASICAESEKIFNQAMGSGGGSPTEGDNLLNPKRVIDAVPAIGNQIEIDKEVAREKRGALCLCMCRGAAYG
jgi:hypothetical protein